MESRLEEWQRGEEFTQKEESSLALRRRVTAAIRGTESGGDGSGSDEDVLPLSDWWNAYDTLETSPTAALSMGDEDEARRLAAWLEAHKFGVSIAGNLCGSEMLNLLVRMATQEVDAETPKLSLFSAHYPTMICLLSALGIGIDSGEQSDEWLGEAIPPLSSAFAFEVHEPVPPSVEPRVELWYWHGSAESDGLSFPDEWMLQRLPCPAAEWCTASELAAIAAERALPNVSAWCEACANVDLAECALAAANGRIAQLTSALALAAPPSPPVGFQGTGGNEWNDDGGISPVAAAFIGALVTAILGIVALLVFRKLLSPKLTARKPVTMTLPGMTKSQNTPQSTPQSTPAANVQMGLSGSRAV